MNVTATISDPLPATLLLEAETRWLIDDGLAPAATLPNYLDHIEASVLKRLWPEVVSVIQGRS